MHVKVLDGAWYIISAQHTLIMTSINIPGPGWDGGDRQLKARGQEGFYQGEISSRSFYQPFTKIPSLITNTEVDMIMVSYFSLHPGPITFRSGSGPRPSAFLKSVQVILMCNQG